MPVAINWAALSGAPDVGAAFTAGYERSRARSALGALARDPNNRDALADLYTVDPASAARMETVSRERAEWQQKQSAMAAQRAYISARYGDQPTQANVLSATATPDALSAPAPSGSMTLPRPSTASQGVDRAWFDYAMADPAGAMQARQTEAEWQSTRLKLNKADLEQHQTVNSEAMRLLNGVSDQMTYDRARADAERLYAQYGYDFPDLPAEYHPELVSALRARALEMKDAIAADLNERKFDWQRQDDRMDNARDDRRIAIQDRASRDASARGWSADRRAERRYRRGDGVNGDLSGLPNDDLINMLEQR